MGEIRSIKDARWVTLKGKRVPLKYLEMDDKSRCVRLQGGSEVGLLDKEELITCLRFPQSVAKEMWEWLSVRPGCAFSERQLEDVGFFSHWGSSYLEPYVDDTEYSFRCLLFASGSAKRFASRGYHASADDRGGHQSFWPIDVFTMKSHQAEGTLDEMAEWCSQIETDLEVPWSPNRKRMRTDVLYDPRAQARYLDNLHLACTRRMDRFFRDRCPGARGDSSALTQLLTDVVNFFYSPRGQFLRASIGTGLHALAGDSVAKEMMFLKWMSASSISQAGTWLEKHLRAFRLEKVNLAGRAGGGGMASPATKWYSLGKSRRVGRFWRRN